MDFLYNILESIFKLLLCTITSTVGIYLGVRNRNIKKLQKKKYFRKHKSKNKILGKTRASLERYWLSTQLNKRRRGIKRRRSRKECYIQCVRILKSAKPEERRMLKAIMNSNMKEREMWGILLAVGTVLSGYIVDSYANYLIELLSTVIPQIVNNDWKNIIGVSWFAIIFFLTYMIVRDASMEIFILNIIEDIEKD